MKKVLILLLWLLPSCSVVIFAQTQRIAGTVVVGDGQPAVGAAIVVKGTNIGCRDECRRQVRNSRSTRFGTTARSVPCRYGTQRGRCCSQRIHSASTRRTMLSWNVKAGVSLFSYRGPDGLDERDRIQCRCRSGI